MRRTSRHGMGRGVKRKGIYKRDIYKKSDKNPKNMRLLNRSEYNGLKLLVAPFLSSDDLSEDYKDYKSKWKKKNKGKNKGKKE